MELNLDGAQCWALVLAVLILRIMVHVPLIIVNGENNRIFKYVESTVILL
jgi:hypothetical protein